MEQKMIKPKFLVFENQQQADKYVSDLIIKQINALPQSNIALPTGSTPLGIYKNLIDAYNSNVVSFEYVKTFNLDEFVGIDKKDYNKSFKWFMEENLFNHININKDNTFYPINYDFNPSSNPNFDYIEFDRLIESNDWLDLTILGVGDDGHIAFNDPGAIYEGFTSLVEFSEKRKNDLTKSFGHRSLVPNYGVTMGIQTILYSRKIVLVAYGKKKAKAIYELFFTEGVYNPEWPLTALNFHSDVVVICDKEAAEEVNSKRIN